MEGRLSGWKKVVLGSEMLLSLAFSGGDMPRNFSDGGIVRVSDGYEITVERDNVYDATVKGGLSGDELARFEKAMELVCHDQDDEPRLRVAVVDSGIARNSEDEPILPSEEDELVDVVDYVDDDGNGADYHGHGSAMVRHLRLENEGGIGECGLDLGVYKVLDRRGNGTLEDLLASLNDLEGYCGVINMSLGAPVDLVSTEMAQYISYRLYLINEGCGVALAAAGNSGEHEFPSTLRFTISVGAVTENMEPYGNTYFGEEVSFVYIGGHTSGATANVSAAIAFLSGVRPDLSKAEIVDVLIETGIRVEGYGDETVHPDVLAALGRLSEIGVRGDFCLDSDESVVWRMEGFESDYYGGFEQFGNNLVMRVEGQNSDIVPGDRVVVSGGSDYDVVYSYVDGNSERIEVDFGSGELGGGNVLDTCDVEEVNFSVYVPALIN